MNTPRRSVWTPAVAEVSGLGYVRITDVRTGEIVYDRLATEDGPVISNAEAVVFPGYDPATDDLPMLATLVAAIANPPVVPAPVPSVVRAAALRYVLNALGLRAAVETAVAAASQDAKDAWEYEVNIRRLDPLVVGFAAALGLSSAQVDDIFRAADQH